MTYRNKTTLEVRELPEGLYEAWVAHDNPKANDWEPYEVPADPSSS